MWNIKIWHGSGKRQSLLDRVSRILYDIKRIVMDNVYFITTHGNLIGNQKFNHSIFSLALFLLRSYCYVMMMMLAVQLSIIIASLASSLYRTLVTFIGVVIVCDCYTGCHSLIPTNGAISLGK